MTATQRNNNYTTFTTFLFPFVLFPFYLPLPTSQSASIILPGFLVHGPTGFHLLDPLVRQCCLQSTNFVRHVVHADDRDADDDVGGVE